MTQPETTPDAAPSAPDPAADSEARPITVHLFARTDVGQVREHNEDNFLVADLTLQKRGLASSEEAAELGYEGSLYAVCDGMGGAAAGEIASQLAVDIIYERMLEPSLEPADKRRDDLARRLVRAVEAAGLRIFQEAKADRSRRGMGTTVTAAALLDDHLFLAQVGDSRGYILREGALVQVTRDQSLVNQLIEAGQLTEEEAETFEHNNIILQALGTSDTVQVDLTYVELRRGDTLLLCSDGLSGMVRNDELKAVLAAGGAPVEICKTLTDRANAAGGHDNITVVIARFDGEGLRAPSGDDELTYRKYSITEDPSDVTKPHRRGSLASLPPSAIAKSVMPPPSTAAAPAAARSEPAVSNSQATLDDVIEIPGTHVPGWVVAMLVLGVVALLLGTAVVLLR